MCCSKGNTVQDNPEKEPDVELPLHHIAILRPSDLAQLLFYDIAELFPEYAPELVYRLAEGVDYIDSEDLIEDGFIPDYIVLRSAFPIEAEHVFGRLASVGWIGLQNNNNNGESA